MKALVVHQPKDVRVKTVNDSLTGWNWVPLQLELLILFLMKQAVRHTWLGKYKWMSNDFLTECL
jgi:hypothetical protein